MRTLWTSGRLGMKAPFGVAADCCAVPESATLRTGTPRRIVS